MKDLKIAVVGVALLATAWLTNAALLFNGLVATNYAGANITLTNTTGTSLPVIPYKDAVITAGVWMTGTNLSTATGTVGFDLYCAGSGQWTTVQPVTATLQTFSNGTANVTYSRIFVPATNLYGASFIRWDTSAINGNTNATFTNVDFTQIP
jgi:hypothetical protein